MEINYLLLFATALIPLAVGSLWYSNFLFGKVWFRESGMTEEKMSSGNMVLIFGLTYLFGLFLSNGLAGWSVHQMMTENLFVMQPGYTDQTGEYYEFFQTFMAKYGDLHRSFGHGAVHGVVATITLALPLIGINALFERRGWKYIGVHFGYWLVVMVLMCGIFSKFI